MSKQTEIKKLIRETQDRIKLQLFQHGMRERLSKKTGISKYKIRQTILDSNPDMELLGKIEKALFKTAA